MYLDLEKYLIKISVNVAATRAYHAYRFIFEIHRLRQEIYSDGCLQNNVLFYLFMILIIN